MTILSQLLKRTCEISYWSARRLTKR